MEWALSGEGKLGQIKQSGEGESTGQRVSEFLEETRFYVIKHIFFFRRMN